MAEMTWERLTELGALKDPESIPELLDEIRRLQAENAPLYSDRIANLEAERDRERQWVEKSEADTKRMDWMLEDLMLRKVYIRDYDEETGKYIYVCMGKTSDTPRGAIDAAINSTKEQSCQTKKQ